MTGVHLPTSVSVASSWQLADFVRWSGTSAPAVDGVATLVVDQVPSGELWLIDRAVVSTSSTSTTALRLYENSPYPENFLSGSGSGNFDEADYPQGLQLAEGTQLVAQWFGAADDAVGRLRLQGRVLRRG